jgi:hypothetical protein
MTDDRSLERAARSWLEMGPTEAPDHAVDAALVRIQTTPQERDWHVPRRNRVMSLPARLVAAAIAIAVVAVGGLFVFRPGGSIVGGSPVTPVHTPAPTPTSSRTEAPSSTPSPTPALGTMHGTESGTLAAGEYHVDDFAVPDLPRGLLSTTASVSCGPRLAIASPTSRRARSDTRRPVASDGSDLGT